ncbi:MAG: thioredoxin-disulfide reductase [Candidatus Dojkabacteria bacterium]|nr:MAG: thioredoxin-disulfide reductase [Candidatus Dojkabacteria bacterium]
MSDQKVHELIIIGSGPAGLTAAIYAARADLKPLLIAGIKFGGQLMDTTLVENYPGFIDGVMGPELMNSMMKQAERFGTEVVYKNADKVDFTGDVKKVYVEDTEYQAKSVILAMGSSPRRLNIPGEQEFYGRGVSTCATCDAAFYRDKIVAVVGGGDSAMEESTFLTKFASKVYVIHRRDEFRASKAMQNRLFENKKIEVIWNAEVTEVVGSEVVTSLKLQDNNGNSLDDITVDGMFLAIGHIPNTQILEGQIELDEQGFIIVKDGRTKTSNEGVFVAGDIKDHVYQQAVTAAGMGCMAAMDVEKWLESKK